MSSIKEHWDAVYRTKQPHQVSWWQDTPKRSLELIHSLNLPKSASIIDIGGGDSTLVDHLLGEGFERVTVLDISEKAIERARLRLGSVAGKVQWVIGDMNEFKSDIAYDLWHDRAAFHFLIDPVQIEMYRSIAERSIKPGGALILGTFSTNGPKSCSGLSVHQYDQPSLSSALGNGFESITSLTEDHLTPFNTKQNFLFCAFHRRNNQ